MLQRSREFIQSAPDNAIPDIRTYAHIQITSVSRQLFNINLCLMACPIA